MNIVPPTHPHAQVIYSLERAEKMLRAECNRLSDQMDYNAQFFEADADSLLEAIKLLTAENIAPNFDFANLEKLCGHWQDGSDEVVRIFQDDALRCFVVEIGKISWTGPTLAEALRLAAITR